MMSESTIAFDNGRELFTRNHYYIGSNQHFKILCQGVS